MSDQIRQLLKELKMALGSLYGERLRGLYLFGSYACGDAEEGSDVDVLIVLDRIDNYSNEIDQFVGCVRSLHAPFSRCPREERPSSGSAQGSFRRV